MTATLSPTPTPTRVRTTHAGQSPPTPRRLADLPAHANLNHLLSVRRAVEPEAVLAEVRTAPDGPWRRVSVRAFDDDVVAVAKGLIARGVRPGDTVGIMSRTRYEWTVLDFALWSVGAVPVPIYETSAAEQVQWILTDARVRFLVVESAVHAATVARVRDDAPDLEDVLVLDDGALDGLVAAGTHVADSAVGHRRSLATLDDLATIIYTSGTTGRPKGVELTHGNFTRLAARTIEALPEVFGTSGRTLLFLPLAHVFARFVQVVAIAGGIVLGHTPDAATLTDDLRAFRPTFLLAVPRVFEKVYNAAEQKAAASGRLRVFHWAARVAIAWSRALDAPGGPSLGLRLQHRLADRLVLARLRAVLGGQATHAVSGGSALGERLGHFYRGLGLEVLEGYGLTESTAPTSVNRPGRARIGTVGPLLPGCEARIAPDGEIQLRGPHIFRGYHNDPRSTREAFDDGWFRTGDLGTLDDAGFLSVTGRTKELIVTAGGKNVSPAVLEDRARAHALVDQCVVVGDDRPFVGALVTIDPDGLAGWLQAHGRPALTIPQAHRDPEVLVSLQAALARANEAVSRAESIRRFVLLTDELTVENGYVTPKQSLRRGVVLKDFAAQVEELYEGGGIPVEPR